MTSLHLASKNFLNFSFLSNSPSLELEDQKWNILQPCHRHPEEYYTEQWIDTKMMNEMLSRQINKQTNI